MIKAIIFDCFGVLTTDQWKEFCSTLPNDEVVKKAKDLNHLYDNSAMGLEDFVANIHKVTGRDRQLIEGIFMNRDSVKNEALLEYIRQLKSKNYKLGILSNVATNWVREYFLTSEEQQLFDAMVFSFELGTGKPEPEIYKTILQKLSVKPQESVFIDDNERYCAAAEELGMKAILYEDFVQMETELEKILAAVTDN